MAHALLKIFYPSLPHQELRFATTGDEGVAFDGLATPLRRARVDMSGQLAETLAAERLRMGHRSFR